MNRKITNENSNEYIQDILQILDLIQESLLDFGTDPKREVVNSLFRGFHAVKGNANMAGIPVVPELASKLEDVISMVRANVIDVNDDFADMLNKSVDFLKTIARESDHKSYGDQAAEFMVFFNNIVSDSTGESDDNVGPERDYLTGLENRKVSDDIASGVSVGGGGVALEISDGDNSSLSNHEENSEQSPHHVPKNSIRPLRILVVEDDFTSRQLLVSALSKYGECHVAKDGREAIQAVEKSFESYPLSTYDLICMDVQMPNMDGTDAARGIRGIEHREGVEGSEHESVIIMISCVEDPKVIMKSCYKCGANHYFVKPLDLNQMNRQMQKLGLIADRPTACIAAD